MSFIEGFGPVCLVRQTSPVLRLALATTFAGAGVVSLRTYTRYGISVECLLAVKFKACPVQCIRSDEYGC
jgi:hypothetical protein